MAMNMVEMRPRTRVRRRRLGGLFWRSDGFELWRRMCLNLEAVLGAEISRISCSVYGSTARVCASFGPTSGITAASRNGQASLTVPMPASRNAALLEPPLYHSHHSNPHNIGVNLGIKRQPTAPTSSLPTTHLTQLWDPGSSNCVCD